jgi:serine O-acetyltransferase
MLIRTGEMDATIACDLYRHAGKTDLQALIKCMIHSPGFRFTYFFRKCTAQKKGTPLWWFYKLMHRRCYYKFGFQIPAGTRIGKGLYIAHFGNLVVHVNAVLGDNCNLAHGVTIGQANRGNRKGCPIIGNKVWFGVGAVVVGKITIGDNVMIAPNAFVNFDVPSNSIVLGNPAKVIHKEDATVDYIESIMPPEHPARAE